MDAHPGRLPPESIVAQGLVMKEMACPSRLKNMAVPERDSLRCDMPAQERSRSPDWVGGGREATLSRRHGSLKRPARGVSPYTTGILWIYEIPLLVAILITCGMHVGKKWRGRKSKMVWCGVLWGWVEVLGLYHDHEAIPSGQDRGEVEIPI